jgi:hypothetical protein
MNIKRSLFPAGTVLSSLTLVWMCLFFFPDHQDQPVQLVLPFANPDSIANPTILDTKERGLKRDLHERVKEPMDDF